MSARFRILPYGVDSWIVERRVLFWWWPESRDNGYGYSSVRTFDSEALAEGHIKDEIARERTRSENRITAGRRLRDIPPRPFP